MTGNSTISNGAIVSASFALFLILLLSSFDAVIFDDRFYDKEFVKYSVYERFGEEKVLLEKAILLDYFTSKDSEIRSDFYNEREKQHLVDVKILIVTFKKLLYFLSLAFIAVIFVVWKKDAKNFVTNLSKIFAIAAILAFIFLGGAYFVLQQDFSSAFVGFHKLFFNNDLWLLNPATDNLINLFQEGFFIDAAARSGITLSTLSMIALITAISSRYYSKHPLH